MVWFAPYKQIGIVFTLNNNIIPEINNNIIKRIEILTSKKLKGLEGDFIVIDSFAISHSFHGVFDCNWERYDTMFVEHLVLSAFL